MGKQKMNRKKVMLVKHLRKSEKWKNQELSDFFNISVGGIRHITGGRRWAEVNQPDYSIGQELYYTYLNNQNAFD